MSLKLVVMKYFYLLIFVISLLSKSLLHAKELYQQGLSARYWGMGGTSVAFARGVDALYLNPAALAKTDGIVLNFVNFSASLSTNSISLKDKLSVTNGSGSISLSDLNSLYGENIFLDVTAYGGVAIPYFAVGAYSNNTTLQSFSNPSNPTYNVNLISDYGYAIGGAFKLTDEISFGLTGRSLKRWSGDLTMPATDLVGSNTQSVLEAALSDKGSGNALDLGFLASFQRSGWNNEIGLAWHDVGMTKFNPTSGKGPERQDDNLIFGYAAQKEFGFTSWLSSIEYKFIRNDGDISKKIDLGTELSLGIFDVRAGYYQGYLSYGGTVDFSFIRIDAASYTGELGTSAGQTANPRYVVSLSLMLDMDKSFKIQAADGKRRRLNQRR